jgi:hypothetical protein
MHPAGGDYKDPERMARFIEALKKSGVACRGGE